MPIQFIAERLPSDEPILNEDVSESVTLKEPQIALHLLNKYEGMGTLYLTSHRVIWLSSEDPHKGYAFTYPFIVLHAISKDATAFEEPCIYCQLQAGWLEQTNNHEDTEDEDNDTNSISEMRLVPANAERLDTIFRVFSEMAALNPSDAEMDSDDDSVDEQFDSDYWAPPEAADGEMEDATFN